MDELLCVQEKFPFLSSPIFIIIQAVDPVCLFGRLITRAAQSMTMAYSGSSIIKVEKTS